METHGKLTVIGAILLVVTFLINNHHQGPEFNYAYIPGIAMLICFGVSLVLFTKDRM